MAALSVGIMWMIGCGDESPVSSTPEEGINAPAGKLTVSGAQAGGYAGRIAIQHLVRAQSRALYSQDIDEWLTYLADDAVYDYVPAPAPMTTKDDIRVFFQDLFQGFPDFHVVSERLLISGNIVVTEHTTLGTHLGEWMGVPPTGKEGPPDYHLDIWEFEGSKVKKVTTYYDALTAMVNMGVIPASEPPSLVPSFAVPDPVTTGLSPLAAARELVDRFNSHDLSLFMEMVHEDAVIFFGPVGVPIDRTAYAALNEIYLLGFSDLTGEYTRLVDMGEGWVLGETLWQSTHDGPYLGVPASGLPSITRSGSLMRFDAEGLMTDFRFYFDNLSVLVQMGALPAP